MRSILLTFIIALGLIQSINAQGVITAVPCDMLGMVMNVGSQETSISIYHSGQYMTHPQSENIMFYVGVYSANKEIYYIKTLLVDASTISFGHSWSSN